LDIVSPAVNFCGGAPGCHDTDPFVYLDKFFSNCGNCDVDYIAVHWYGCTADSLKWYLDRLRKYNKKVWVTEFSCAQWDGNWKNDLAFQINYMKEAVRILENEPMVFRYAWFSGRTTEIPNVNIFQAQSGQLTQLGREYLAQPCGRATAVDGDGETLSQRSPPARLTAPARGVLIIIGIAVAGLTILACFAYIKQHKKTVETV